MTLPSCRSLFCSHDMKEISLSPDFLFETSWEVCNKVGGIYTVLSSHAKTLKTRFNDGLVFIGPDFKQPAANPDFIEDTELLPAWREASSAAGIPCRIGRWDVPGRPIAVLVDFTPLYAEKDEIYAAAWQLFGVSSIRAYGDYDEASMFSTAAGRFVAAIVGSCLDKKAKVVYQAHEWMSGLGMLFLKHQHPHVATVFTTHATSIGRSIAGNNKQLYAYFKGYNGNQMAEELHMEAKHSIERQSAHLADCFTTVSTFTDLECRQLLDRPADVILPNGFEPDFVPKGAAFTATRRKARTRILEVASKLLGTQMPADTLIVSTSGRNDYRCKGFDVFFESMARLKRALQEKEDTQVLALIEVPCWVKQPRQDLLERLTLPQPALEPLHEPIITHELNNFYEDRIIATIHSLGLTNKATDHVKVILIPCYLDGKDGIFNLSYYDMLTANDLTIYPSYYEPWGYTPLESCAFHTPCITTDLSGFGQWVEAELKGKASLSDGVCVLHRDDNNYYDTADAIAQTILTLAATPEKERTAIRNKATRLSAKAEWQHFISHYYQAYHVALKKATSQPA